MPKHNQTHQQKRKFPSVIPHLDIVKNDAEETVVMGHPESAGIYSMRYNNGDPYLGDSPERQDYEYVSPERMRLRSKYGSNF